uniref:PSP domain-containing protein n=1 Tax=Caenorhabditis japonica TaxID=281687 RepID=A0A8R1HK01_CAEJA
MSDIEIIEAPQQDDQKSQRTKDGEPASKKKRVSRLIEKSSKMKGTETEFEEFVIDRTTTVQTKLTVEEVEKSEENGSSSQWRKRLECTLLGAEPSNNGGEEKKKNRFKKLCFNCDGEHTVYDCPQPKDRQRIAKKKRESADAVHHRQQIQNSGLTKQGDKAKTSYKPGELSKELRAALGLRKNDIPEHVYRMRRLGFIKGYPPGWLRKAIKSTGVLKFYTTDETAGEEAEEDVELDSSKIIWYPGFNGFGANLNDIESFKIPPKAVFFEGFQQELKDQSVARRKREKRISKWQKRKRASKSESSDVIIIETEEVEEEEMAKQCKTPGEEGKVVILMGNEDVPVEMGASMFHTLGTPVRHKLQDVVPLEAFAVGIQPFESREEETVNKGNFRKLMDNLKTLREQTITVSDAIESSSDVIIVKDTLSRKRRHNQANNKKRNRNSKAKQQRKSGG